MLRKTILVVLVSIIALQAMIQAFTMIDWKVNQSYITARYCVNKNKPELKCNGQCQLAKRLRKIENEINFLEKKGSNKEKKQVKVKSVELFVLAMDFSHFKYLMIAELKSTSFYIKNFYQFEYLSLIDHPPCAIG